MMLTIGIIALVAMVISLVHNLDEGRIKVSYAYTAIAILAWWDICFPLALIILIAVSIYNLTGLIMDNID